MRNKTSKCHKISRFSFYVNLFVATTSSLRRLGFFDGFDDEHWISVGISWNCCSNIVRISWFKASGVLKVAIDQLQMLTIVHL